MDSRVFILCLCLASRLLQTCVSADNEIAYPCQLAPACECLTDSIVCTEAAPDKPIFTYYERVGVETIELVKNQLQYLKKVCELFPALDSVNLQSNVCPRQSVTCAFLRCT